LLLIFLSGEYLLPLSVQEEAKEALNKTLAISTTLPKPHILPIRKNGFTRELTAALAHEIQNPLNS